MHLSAAHGNTIDEIAAAGLPVSAKVAVDLEHARPALSWPVISAQCCKDSSTRSRNLSPMWCCCWETAEKMLAGALAAIHLNIPMRIFMAANALAPSMSPYAMRFPSCLTFTLPPPMKHGSVFSTWAKMPKSVVTGRPGLDGLKELANLPEASFFQRT